MHIRKNDNYKIYIEFKDFKSGIPYDSSSSFEFSGLELIHAITTCGVINPLSEASAEFKYKKYSLECQFTEKKNELYLSKEYENYDQSEKNCLSYYRGMVFGRLIAMKRFDLTVFVHLSNFLKCNKIVKSKSGLNLLPDIIGWKNNGEYFVWECKGHRAALLHGKDQANSITNINKKDVEMNIVSAVYPTRKLKRIFACVKDPVNEGRPIKIDIEECLVSYYTPIVKLIKELFVKEKDKIMFAEMDLGDEVITIGLPSDIFQSVDCYNKNNLNKRISIKDILDKNSDGIFNEYRINMFNDFIWLK